MTAYNILFRATDTIYGDSGTLYIGRVAADSEDSAFAKAIATLGAHKYELIGLCRAPTTDTGHGESLKAIVPVPTLKVNGTLRMGDLT